MTRTARLKLLYLMVLATLGAGVVALLTGPLAERRLAGGLALAVCLLIPGRIQGLFYRDLFVGRRLIASQNWRAAAEACERFCRSLEEAPWKRRLLWLAWSVYTVDGLAMGQNNLGAARFGAGDWDGAEQAWRAALATDADYPLPHVNLARLAVVRDDRDAAQAHLEDAERLGFAATRVDQLVNELQELLARVEGGG